jgi:hypothetical protein
MAATTPAHHGDGADLRAGDALAVMRQRGNEFEVIPRSFDDEKESTLPHCSRGN